MNRFNFSFGGQDRPVIASPVAISPKEYEYIRKLVYDQSRINLGDNKRELVMARLSKRLRALRLPSYADYIRLLDSPAGKEEFVNLIDSISTNHTFFFREVAHFNFLVEQVLPEMCPPGSSRGGRFRVWSAATSTGEEPYSIALTLNDYFARNTGWRWQVDCTDISTKALAKARAGLFSNDRVAKIRPDWLKQHFVQKGQEGYEARTSLKANMSFSCLNLFAPTYPFREPFDVVFCRNVMIYFDRQTQETLVNKLATVMRPGAYLMIGHAESLTSIKHPFQMVKPAIYRLPA